MPNSFVPSKDFDKVIADLVHPHLEDTKRQFDGMIARVRREHAGASVDEFRLALTREFDRLGWRFDDEAELTEYAEVLASGGEIVARIA